MATQYIAFFPTYHLPSSHLYVLVLQSRRSNKLYIFAHTVFSNQLLIAIELSHVKFPIPVHFHVLVNRSNVDPF